MIDIVKTHPWYASLLGVILIYALLGFLLAPFVLHKTLVQTMQRDFEAELRIENIEINPFALSLRIDGIELDNPQGEPTARLREVFANFQLSSIFRLALTFDEIRFSGPELFVERDASGNLDFEYLTRTNDTAVATDDGVEGSDASLLQALVYRFRIDDFYINWSDRFPPEPVQTRIGPISIEIEELNTLPDRSGQQAIVIATQNSGTLSLNGELQLNPLRASGRAVLDETRFPLVSAYVRHQTGVDIVDGSADVDLDYEVYTTESGQLTARIVNFNLAFTDIVINSYADGTGIDLAGPDQQILQLPAVRLADGEFEWPQQKISLGSISIDKPKIDLTRAEDGVFSIEPRQLNAGESDTGAAGDAAAERNDEDGNAKQWLLEIGKFDIDGLALDLVDRSVSPEASLGVTDLNLNVSGISNQPGKRFPTSLSLQVASGGQISLRGEVAILPEPQFELDLDLDSLRLAAAQPYLRQQANLSLDSGALNLKGRASGTTAEPLSFNGDLAVADLAIAESIDGKLLAGWQAFRANNIAFSLAGRQLDISRIRFEKLYSDILIDADGKLNFAQVIKSDAGKTDAGAKPATDADAASESTAVENQPPLKIRIGDVVLANASADFSDLSLPLPFAVKIDALNGKITTITTESSEPSEVSLEGKVDQYGLARVGGTVTPLQPADDTRIKVSFENIDVPKFTPYSIPFAGRKIASGKLDLDLEYQLEKGRLIGNNSIVLRDFELGDAVPHPNALDLPLGLAVALLKDASGKIDIDLEVSGDVDAPDFNIGAVIRDALGNLLTKIVLSPFAALGRLLGVEASELDHIEFLAGRSDLSPPQMEKAAKLAEALSLRPQLRLAIAGVYAAEADAAALRSDRLDQILEQRITDLTAANDAAAQYPDLRRQALEQWYREQLDAGAVTESLDELRARFIRQAEGQTEPVLDRLAYANELRTRLVDLQQIDASDFNELASARAEALQAALLANAEALRDRVSIAANTQLEQEQDEVIRMEVTLDAKS